MEGEGRRRDREKEEETEPCFRGPSGEEGQEGQPPLPHSLAGLAGKKVKDSESTGDVSKLESRRHEGVMMQRVRGHPTHLSPAKVEYTLFVSPPKP